MMLPWVLCYKQFSKLVGGRGGGGWKGVTRRGGTVDDKSFLQVVQVQLKCPCGRWPEADFVWNEALEYFCAIFNSQLQTLTIRVIETT